MSIRNCLIAGLITIGTSSYAQDNNYNSIVEARKGTGHIYQVSQKDAEKSIRELAKTSYLEEAWMYYDSMLYDVGTDEDSTKLKLKFPDNLDSTQSITLYHIHPKKELSPPSIEDIIYVPAIRNKLKANIIDKVYDSEGVWEFSLEESLIKQLNSITDYKEKYNFVRNKINIAYDPTNKYKVFGQTPYPYNPTSVKEHIRIMQDIGVNLTYKKR